MREFKSILLAAALSFSVTASAKPGGSTPADKPPVRKFDSVRVEGIDIPPIPNAPFYAKVTLELRQTLPNGSSATHKTFNIIARDSRGRTRNEIRFWSPADGSDPELYYCILYDPASRIRTYVFPTGRSGAQFVVDPAASTASPNPPDAGLPSVQKVDLGSATEDGLTVQGTRETITYPPTDPKGDQSGVVIQESWYSPELQVVLKCTTTDSRYGTETVGLTGLEREEPASALLDVPKNYHVYGEQGPGSELPVGGYAPPIRIRADSDVTKKMLVKHVQPEYPPLARETYISGVVHLRAIIGMDGSVTQIEVVSGHPLLVQAALDAVRKWRYHSFFVDGLPVEVDTAVEVNFQLSY